MNQKSNETFLRVVIAIPLILVEYLCFHIGGVAWYVLCVGVFCVGVIIEVLWRIDHSARWTESKRHSRLLMLSALIGGPTLNVLHEEEMGRGFILLGAIMVVVFDSLSYIVGKGQPRRWRKAIAPRESPKKTWGGFIGGTVLSWGAGYIVIGLIEANYVRFDVNRPLLYLTVAVLPIVAFFGDLNQSMAKRRLFRSYLDRQKGLSIKDMSRVFGPHGGLSDRFDALLAVFSTIGVVWYVTVYFA